MRQPRIGGPVLIAVLAAGAFAGCATAPAAIVSPSSSGVPSTSPAVPSSGGSEPSPPIASAAPTASAEPVVLDASGTTTATVTAAGGIPFRATDGGSARCQSHPDSQAAESITGLDLGELGPGTLRVMIGLPLLAGPASVELFIDGGDLPEGSFQPFWSGSGPVTSRAPGATSGSVMVREATLEADAGSKPGISPLPGVADWPVSLKATIEWSCGAWVETVPGPSAPPPSIAP